MTRKLLVAISFTLVFAVLSCDSDGGAKLKLGFEEYDFGNVDLRQKDSVQLTIENTTSKVYNVTNFRLSGFNAADFSIVGGGTYMILPKEIKQITIEFEPQDAGVRVGVLEFDSSAQSKSFLIDLIGNGVATPLCEVDNTLHDYGKTYVTFTKTFDFEIANKGTGDLNISQMSFSGPNASDFTITAGIAPVTIHSNFTDPTNFTHKITVEYAPQIAGKSTATLEIVHDAASSPESITLEGTAEDPFSDLSVTPDPIEFAGILVGNNGDIDVEIESTGVLDLNISDIEIVAGNSTEFAIQAVVNDGTPVNSAPYACQVPIGKKCVVTIRFTPTSDGQGKTSTLKITSDANSSPTNINIEGATGFPVLINECDMGTDDYVELYNIGTSPIDISGWKLSTWYLRSGNNQLCGTYTFPNASIIPAGSCVTCAEQSKAGDYQLGYQIWWSSNDGGEAILLDKNGIGVDYMYFNMSSPQHIPSNLSWGSAIPGTAIVNHYRHNKINTFSSNDWSTRSSPGTDYGTPNPGQ